MLNPFRLQKLNFSSKHLDRIGFGGSGSIFKARIINREALYNLFPNTVSLYPILFYLFCISSYIYTLNVFQFGAPHVIFNVVLCCLLVLTHIGLTSSHLNRASPTLLDLLLITLLSLLYFLLILLTLSFLSSPIPELLLLSPYLLSPLKVILLITTPVYCLISLRSLFKHFSQKYNDSTLIEIEKMFHTLKDRSLDEVIIKKYDNSKKMDQECRAIDRLNQQDIPTSVHASEIIATTQAPPSIVFFAQKGPVKDLFSSTIKGTAAGVSFVRAVATLHQKGIGHGDIKPHNALSTPEGTKLIDFESSLHGQDITLFTWSYTPPQMFSLGRDKKLQPTAIDFDRCKIGLHDCYALGVAISEMYLEDNDVSLSIPLEMIKPLLAHLPWIQEKTNAFIRPSGQQENYCVAEI